MSRVQARLRVVAVVALVLVLAGATTAQAAPLSRSSISVVDTASHWWDAAAAWFGGFFQLNGGKGVQKPAGKAPQGPSSVTAPLGGNAVPNNGSCIDPMGGPRCAV